MGKINCIIYNCNEHQLKYQLESVYNNKRIILIKDVEVIKKENNFMIIVLSKDNDLFLFLEKVKNWTWNNVLNK